LGRVLFPHFHNIHFETLIPIECPSPSQRIRLRRWCALTQRYLQIHMSYKSTVECIHFCAKKSPKRKLNININMPFCKRCPHGKGIPYIYGPESLRTDPKATCRPIHSPQYGLRGRLDATLRVNAPDPPAPAPGMVPRETAGKPTGGSNQAALGIPADWIQITLGGLSAWYEYGSGIRFVFFPFANRAFSMPPCARIYISGSSVHTPSNYLGRVRFPR